MVLEATQMTAADLLNLADDGSRYELVRGELRGMAPAGADHGRRAGRLAVYLGYYVLENNLGEIYIADTGFLLSTDPDTVRAPDIAFIAHDRLPEESVPIGYLTIAPDLAVEVISPSESGEDIQEKVDDYLRAGTKQVWTLYRKTRSVVIHHADGSTMPLRENDRLDGGDVIPGFSVPVARLFPK